MSNGVHVAEEDTTVAENTAKARRIFDQLFNRGDDSWLDTELFGPGFILYAPTLPAPGGPQDVKDFVRELHTAFPDLHVQTEDIIAAGNKVVVRWRTTSQTHLGPYRGIPPSGKRINMTGVHIFRFAEGKLYETWLEIDAVKGLQQMGVVPPLDVSTLKRVAFVWASPVRLALRQARHTLSSRRATPSG